MGSRCLEMFVRSVLLTFLFCWSLVPAQAQSWPALKTTFGSLWDQPRTQAEAESSGWRLLGSCSDKFLGERYAHPDDNSIIIIFDVAGFIAGTQSVVPVDKVDSGYVWQHVANLDGDRWEHPTHFAVDSIINSPPTCVNEYVDNPGLSTMHHYFWNYPLLILCPLRHDRSLSGYRKMMTSN